jgi:hypothetical protein
MDKVKIAKWMVFEKKFEMVIQVITGTVIFFVSIVGVFKLVNISYELSLPSVLIAIIIIVILISLAVYLVLKISLNQSFNKWAIVVNAIESQITSSLEHDTKYKETAISDSLPRDSVIDYQLARHVLSTLKTYPFLELALDARREKIDIESIEKKSLKIYMDTPGMFKTYLIIQEAAEEIGVPGDEVFFVNCFGTSSYERDYAFTIFSLIFPILSSTTDSISQIYSSDISINVGGYGPITFYHLIFHYELKKKKDGGYLLRIPII